jgi:drug/metabolite transporter (DMT)-like permease
LSPLSKRARAVWLLVLCAAFWGVSFPGMKALLFLQEPLVPKDSSWFLASLCIFYRFSLAAMILALLFWKRMVRLTRSELLQGIGIGFCGAGGMLFQMDGIAHTSASTSAFLTQCYCILIPLWVAFTRKKRPSILAMLSCLLVMGGAAILAEMDWKTLHMGRGEMETLVAAVLFTGQILWLQRPSYAGNDAVRFGVVSFATMALFALPFAVMLAPTPWDLVRAYASPSAGALLAVLVVVCTLGGNMLMNLFQRDVSETHAGLIYSLEPVFASALALFLPGWLSIWTGVNYPNEVLHPSLLVGGLLILVANVLIQVDPSQR